MVRITRYPVGCDSEFGPTGCVRVANLTTSEYKPDRPTRSAVAANAAEDDRGAGARGSLAGAPLAGDLQATDRRFPVQRCNLLASSLCPPARGGAVHGGLNTSSSFGSRSSSSPPSLLPQPQLRLAVSRKVRRPRSSSQPSGPLPPKPTARVPGPKPPSCTASGASSAGGASSTGSRGAPCCFYTSRPGLELQVLQLREP